MLSGELSSEEYAKYLLSQYAIFSTIENLYSLPYLGMYREDLILSDLEELGVIDLTDIGQSTKAYCDYLKELSRSNIMPHIYLNYMAHMMGGQIIKSKVPGSGRMYDFGPRKDVNLYVQHIREQQDDMAWADEVNKGYDYIISILHELQEFLG
jgi:hypothetical protein